MVYESKGTLVHSDTGVANAYDNVIYEHFNNEVTFYRDIKKKPSPSINYRFLARVTRNTMVGPTNSTDDLIGGSSGRIALYSHLRQYKAPVAIEDAAVLEFNKNGIGNLSNIWAEEMNAAMLDLSKDLNESFLDSGTSLGSSFGDAVDSLGAILQDSGNIYGKSRSTYSSLAANVTSGVGDLTISKLRGYITTLKENGGRDFIMYTTPTVADYIRNEMTTDKMYIGVSSKAGFEGALTFDGIIIKEDSDIPSGYLYILDYPQFFIAEFQKFAIGQLLGKSNLTTTKYIWGILNLICTRMNTSAKVYGITS